MTIDVWMTNVARQPMAHHACRQLRRVGGARSRVRLLGCSSVVLGVAAYLAGAPPACAHDMATPNVHAAKAPSTAPSVPVLLPRFEPAPLLTMIEQNRAAASAGATDDLHEPASTAAHSAVEPDGEACEPGCPPKRPSPKSPMSLLPEVILRNLNEVPVLAAFIMPVTEGVTITPAEGLPAVTFTVKPTKFTRGSGLVAVSRF